jgi:hypothetical protein
MGGAPDESFVFCGQSPLDRMLLQLCVHFDNLLRDLRVFRRRKGDP